MTTDSLHEQARKNFLDSIACLPEGVRDILNEWETFDEGLQDHYCDEVDWFLRAAKHRFKDAPEVGELFEKIKPMAVEMKEKMGIDILAYMV